MLAVSRNNLAYITERTAHMTRLLIGLLTAVVLTLVSGVTPTNAAPSQGGGPGIGGQVTRIDGTTITVQARNGTVTIATTASTTFEVSGASASLSSITVGMVIKAEGTRSVDGVFTATRVIGGSPARNGNKPPRGHLGVGGRVMGIDGATITVQVRNTTATIATTANTTFEVNGASASLSSITVGMVIKAEGSRGADGVFTATKVIASSEQGSRPPRR
jgi:hypothetical protein